MAQGTTGDLVWAAGEGAFSWQAFRFGTAACRFPSLSWKGSVLGLLGCLLSSWVPAPGCGVSSVIWRSSRESKERVTSLTHRLPSHYCAESRAFPGSALLCWLVYCPAPLRRGLCNAPQPEAVKLSCWLIKAGCLGRPICSQVNCAAIFSLWQAYKKLPSVLPKDGRVVSCARAHIPSLLFWRHNSQHGVTLKLPCVGIKDWVTPSPTAASWTPTKHPLPFHCFWQLLCPLLSVMFPLAAATHHLIITWSLICYRSCLVLQRGTWEGKCLPGVQVIHVYLVW